MFSVVFECLGIAFGAFVVAIVCLGIISGTSTCAGVDLTSAQCASPTEFVIFSYFAFSLLGIVYADIRRKGIDPTSSSLGILLHDYAFRKNYSQRVHSANYATSQGIYAGFFVGSFGIPVALKYAASMLGGSIAFVPKNSLDTTLLEWWWCLLALIPLLFIVMSKNRIAAEEFISHLQFMQNSINFYRNHGEAVIVMAEQGTTDSVDPHAEETEDASDMTKLLRASGQLKIPPPPPPTL
jgi:hypothetical protein